MRANQHRTRDPIGAPKIQ